MSEEIRKYMSLMESFYTSSPYGMQGADDQDDKESVSYNRTKKQGDATVTVSANAESMDELHNILKLAGIDPHGLEGSKKPEEPDHDHDEEPKQGEYADVCDGCGKPGDECECSDCDQHGDDEESKMKMKVISLKPKATGYDPVAGDKKEILNALMNRYKSL